MKRFLGLSLALVLAGGAGYFFGVAQGERSSEVPENHFSATPSSAGATDLKLPEIATSPRFHARLAHLQQIRRASVEELWNRLLSGAGSPLDQSLILDRILATDPAAAIELARTSGETLWLAQIMREWSARDPIAAFRQFEKLPRFGSSSIEHGDLYKNALLEAIRRSDDDLIFEVLDQATWLHPNALHDLSAETARSFLDRLVGRNSRHIMVESALTALANSDFEAAKQWVAANGDGAQTYQRKEWTKLMLQVEIGKDFDAAVKNALDYLENNPSDERFATKIAFEAAQHHPQGAIALLEKAIAGKAALQRDALADIFVNWIPADQREVIVAELKERGFFPESPATNAAEPIYHDLLTPDGKPIMAPFARNQPVPALPVPAKEATEIVAAADATKVSPKVAAAVAYHYSGSDPEAALAWAAGLGDSLSLPAARAALERWVALDADAAMDYAVRLPDSEFQTAAAAAIVQKRVRLDRGATREWIENLDANPFRDAAAQVLVSSAGGDEVGGLIPLANGISDEAQRREALLHLLDQWPSSDKGPSTLLDDPAISAADRKFLEEASFRAPIP